MAKSETSGAGVFIALLFIGGLTAVVLTGTKAKSFVENLRKQVVAIRMKKGSTLLTTKLEFDLALTNDSPSSLLFQSFNGSLFYKSTALTQFSINQQQTIVANDTTILRVPLAINNLQALDTVLELILNKKVEVPFRIKGIVRIENLNFEIDEAIILKPKEDISGIAGAFITRSKNKFDTARKAWQDIASKTGLEPIDVSKSQHTSTQWRWARV